MPVYHVGCGENDCSFHKEVPDRATAVEEAENHEHSKTYFSVTSNAVK